MSILLNILVAFFGLVNFFEGCRGDAPSRLSGHSLISGRGISAVEELQGLLRGLEAVSREHGDDDLIG
jgi:hypothetical protein